MSFDRALKIAPSILSADFANFGAECEAIESEGADWVHGFTPGLEAFHNIDVVDHDGEALHFLLRRAGQL